jgi:hypothetical protein
MDEFEELAEAAQARRISREILSLIEDRNEVGLKQYLAQSNCQQYDSTWCSCIGLLMHLRNSRPDDFDWLAWAVSGYPAYRRIMNDYFLYLYDRKNGNLQDITLPNFSDGN